MYYLVNGYRFITPSKLEIHEMFAAKICIQQLRYKIMQKSASKEFIKTFYTYF